MASGDLQLGKVVIEGKTKVVHEIAGRPGTVLLQSKDKITAGDGARANEMEGKAELANLTSANIFTLLNKAGVKTAFLETHSPTSFVGVQCEMVPIEWVTRRVATGSFLKRNPGVKEGFRFSPPKLETFFKDDENHDPQWSREQLLEAALVVGGVKIGDTEVCIMERTTVTVFEILERAWAQRDCALIDMKIEFGVSPSGEILLADVIDNDSWRLWPGGDKRLMRDKQVYRNLAEVTVEAMADIKKNYAWVREQTDALVAGARSAGRVLVVMGSASDRAHCEKIAKVCKELGVACVLRVSSAHKGTDATLQVLAEYEGDGVPTVVVAAAGRSNGLGPVMSGNTAWPVINCPPVTADWGAQDVWSSLRLPSGLGCATVLAPEAAALQAAAMLGLRDAAAWSALRARQLNTWVGLKLADRELNNNL